MAFKNIKRRIWTTRAGNTLSVANGWTVDGTLYQHLTTDGHAAGKTGEQNVKITNSQPMNKQLFVLCLSALIFGRVGHPPRQSPCSDQSILDMKGSWKQHADANMKENKDQPPSTTVSI